MFKIIDILFLTPLLGSLLLSDACQTVKTTDKHFDENYFYLSNELFITKDQTDFNKFTWSGGKKAYIQRNTVPKVGEQIDVDVINCAGYLGSGKAIYIEGFEWKIEMIHNSMPSDIAQRVRQCSTQSGIDPERDLAVAVVRNGKNRQDSKMEAISGQKAFADLPKDTQDWANCERENKGILGNGADDDWMDTDSDGKIDIVRISAACQGNGMCENKGDYICTKWFKLIDGKWIQMSFSTPA